LAILRAYLAVIVIVAVAVVCVSACSVVFWVHDAIRQAAKAGEISTKARANITQHVELFRQCMFLMFSYQELSVPFNYIHLVELLSTIYCPLFAMAVALRDVTNMGVVADVLVIAIVNVFIHGVYRIARKLQDAIGSDVEDLSVITHCRECIKMCRAIEQLPTMPQHDPAIERRLELGEEIF
jgi:predicted membrane chloride channel (bestrophin family)